MHILFCDVRSLVHDGRAVIDIYQTRDLEWRMVKYAIRVPSKRRYELYLRHKNVPKGALERYLL
jgi:hypothetical protein